jgi:hypothetical protein
MSLAPYLRIAQSTDREVLQVLSSERDYRSDHPYPFAGLERTSCCRPRSEARKRRSDHESTFVCRVLSGDCGLAPGFDSFRRQVLTRWFIEILRQSVPSNDAFGGRAWTQIATPPHDDPARHSFSRARRAPVQKARLLTIRGTDGVSGGRSTRYPDRAAARTAKALPTTDDSGSFADKRRSL